MKILVMSDSHGNTDAVLRAIRQVSPELILHLGDHERDCYAVREAFPELPLRSVIGNCDRTRGLETDEFVLTGQHFFMTHGHLYGVKLGLASIINSASARGADVLLFGHTHNPYYANIDNLYIINPGSIGRQGGTGKKTYAVLEIEDGVINCEFGSLDDVIS